MEVNNGSSPYPSCVLPHLGSLPILITGLQKSKYLSLPRMLAKALASSEIALPCIQASLGFQVAAKPIAATMTRTASTSGYELGLLAAAGSLTIIPGAIVIYFVRNYIENYYPQIFS